LDLPTNLDQFLGLPTTLAFIAFVQVQSKCLLPLIGILLSTDHLHSLCHLTFGIVRLGDLNSLMNQLIAFLSLNTRKSALVKDKPTSGSIALLPSFQTKVYQSPIEVQKSVVLDIYGG